MEIRVIASGGTAGQDAFFIRSLIDGLVIGSMPVFDDWRLPPLYESGVRWQMAELHGSGQEDLDPPPVVLARGVGDCGNLTFWRLCEINRDRWVPMIRRTRGEERIVGIRWRRPPARAVVTWEGDDMHAWLLHPDGTEEDPSRKLGMP